jgi:cell division protein FtsB
VLFTMLTKIGAREGAMVADEILGHVKSAQKTCAHLIEAARDGFAPIRKMQDAVAKCEEENMQLRERVDALEMPWAKLVKEAAGDDGIDSQAFVTRLWKKIEDQKRELSRLSQDNAQLQYALEQSEAKWLADSQLSKVTKP